MIRCVTKICWGVQGMDIGRDFNEYDVKAEKETKTGLLSGVVLKGIRYFSLLVILVIVWEVVCRYGAVKSYSMPAPGMIVQDAVEKLRSGVLLKHITVSFLRVLEGFLVALISALILGVLIGLSKHVEQFTELVLQILKPIPPIAWIPLAILWFGIGESSKLYIIFYGAFFPILLNTVDGIHNIDKRYLELGRVYEMKKVRLVSKVILPGALPSILTGIRVGLGNAWVCVVAAEMIAATKGIGYMLSNGRSMSRADDVILAMLLIGIVGKIMDDVLKILSARLMKWK
ncbi:sulfonate transport system permease protein [Lachnospiraceae bacterium]|nr:sulfonate transport system permease protein [Lachnospiraceae bacterium]